MTQQAGDTKQGLLWKQEHLSPLPIPTGQPASDILGMIWRKNDVYLDIGSLSLAGGWVTLYLGTLLHLGMITYSLSQGFYLLAVLILAVGGGVMTFLWIGYIRVYRRPLMPPLRFHRQRREVRIVADDGEEWTVPWERVHAIAPSATMVGQFGAAKVGGLLLWFPFKDEIDEPYHDKKPGWIIMVSPGPGAAAMRQWECIRSFMEIGPEVVPEPTLVPDPDLSIWQGFIKRMREGMVKNGWFRTIFWDGLFSFVFNLFAYYYLMRKKFAVIPDLTSPESIAWSQPLPPEQWARRSAELEAAIAEREKDLAASEEFQVSG
ncbi:hypothetical protein ACFSB1_17635 [Halopseudomonas phragmitis]|uniref:Uncharacterized protein n=1 Tax=Halopseudomonas phragmitis TaxID=1931241 RepID=A0A1V0B2U4_9GAMM|nr:hypothetical protein [Halopseudomonas phragmitis]AQZ94256.1 hypothetical protein BVH74_05580 [Halopseudomonas phragmitis]